MLGRICLISLVLMTASSILAYALMQEKPQWSETIFTFIAFQMWFGPTLWIYTKLQTCETFKLEFKLLLHFVPAPVFALLWINQLPLTADDFFYFAYNQTDLDNMQSYRLVHKVGAWCSLIGYFIACLKLLHPHKENMKASYSELSKVDLKWLKALIWATFVTVVLCILVEISKIVGMEHGVNSGDIMMLVTLVFTLIQLQFGMKQQDIFNHDKARETKIFAVEKRVAEVVNDAEQGKKYQTSSLKQEQAEKLWQKLQLVMVEHRPHLEPGLKISELAVLLDVSVNHLSETFNGYAKCSFYDFINQLRIEEACRLFTEPSLSRFSVIDIGFQAGFSSTSTFYSYFKKVTGMTPKQYRSQILATESS